jgi:hypothetical protein
MWSFLISGLCINKSGHRPSDTRRNPPYTRHSLTDTRSLVVGNVGEAVDGPEVAELLDNSLLGDEILVDHAGEGKHSKAGVLDLSEGIPLALGGVVHLQTRPHRQQRERHFFGTLSLFC